MLFHQLVVWQVMLLAVVMGMMQQFHGGQQKVQQEASVATGTGELKNGTTGSESPRTTTEAQQNAPMPAVATAG